MYGLVGTPLFAANLLIAEKNSVVSVLVFVGFVSFVFGVLKMFVVHRFPLMSAVNVLVIPESSKVLSVGLSGNGVPSVWYMMEAKNPTGQVVESGFAGSVVGTGFRSL